MTSSGRATLALVQPPSNQATKPEGDEVAGKVVDSILGLHVNSEDDEQLANVLNNATGLRSQETGQATGVAI